MMAAVSRTEMVSVQVRSLTASRCTHVAQATLEHPSAFHYLESHDQQSEVACRISFRDSVAATSLGQKSVSNLEVFRHVIAVQTK